MLMEYDYVSAAAIDAEKCPLLPSGMQKVHFIGLLGINIFVKIKFMRMILSKWLSVLIDFPSSIYLATVLGKREINKGGEENSQMSPYKNASLQNKCCCCCRLG